ncbi:MAG TPA: ABC transporter ATP-binding protein [Flexilinea sp.]|nr:ABC transporter ATP-binding protein [Flexilinea sp.]OQA24935.1 MAG: putative HMP/thiamine import ATP-binding protein YkoD [Chloroflexi bacterium ADurb.Bin344]HOG22473.1 ABC transporter ATP-binding protein [Flexilinea sp.]HOG59853.1 ABC transporter ATP-binding protein [Flexilinea sp.]HOU20007.1 ABC transporter ATP-binding protein [Flexilinea sp.]
MSEPVIEFKNYSFHYRAQEKPTLYNIDLRITKGEKILIAGPSGSGKSTIVHCINGLIPHYYKGESTGELLIHGEKAENLKIFDRSKIIGTVLQDSDGQFVGQSVGEDIAFALENECTPQPEMKDIVDRVSKIVNINHHLENAPQEISGGQKQRVSLAGVLVDDVDILLFDEPLANLDPATGRYTMELIDRLSKETGKTIIIVEHRLEDVLWCPIDRVIVMNDGRIVADEPPDQILSTGLLRQYGIREPLYITSLSYAGIQITPEMHPSHINTLKMDAVRQPLLRWYQQIPPSEAESQAESILSLQNVSFSYDGLHEVLHHIRFDIHKGEMSAIVGKNGAGKSTLCKLICGFEKPCSGDIIMNGKNLNGVSIRDRANTVGYVMQNPNQMISKVLIREEVGLGLKLRDVDPQEIEERVNAVLQICGLYPFRNWPISALSYGQKKRVTIASILVLEPQIILLDEPTAGQDFRHYTEIMEFLQTLQERGLTILLITHDMHLMLEYTRRAIVIADGRLICDDSPARVLSDLNIIRPADLKETSLFTLAEKACLDDPLNFVQCFIDYDRRVRKTWHQ